MAGIPQIPVEELKLCADGVPLISSAAAEPLVPKNSQGFRKIILTMARDSGQYLAGLALLSLASVALVPLYTRQLTPVAFGAYALIDVSILSILTISSLGLNVAYLKWFAEAKPEEVPLLFMTVLGAGSAAAALLGLSLTYLLHGKTVDPSFGMPVREISWMLLPIVCAETLQTLFLAHLRAARRPWAFCAGSVIRLAGVVAASLWFLLVQHQGLRGVFLGRLFGDIAGIAVFAVLSIDALQLSFCRKRASEMVRFGLPLVFSALMAALLDASGRYFLSHYGTLAEVGLYGLGMKLSGLLRVFLVAPFGVAWGGIMFRISREENAQLIYSKLFGYVLAIGVAAAAVTDLFTPEALRVFATPAYFGAERVVPLLLMTQAVAMMQYPASVGIYLRGSTRLFAPIYGGSLALDLLLNRLLVPRLGIRGAAISWLISWAVLVSATACVGQRLYPLRYEWKPWLIAGMAWVAVSVFKTVGISGVSISGLAYSCCLCIVLISLVIWFVWSDFHKTAAGIERLPRTQPVDEQWTSPAQAVFKQEAQG
jgi:O-antigen/teichoic acid export membrane protein